MYYDSIGELGRRIRENTVSPVEVDELCLKRIKTLNPTLNAFITVMADDARDQARAAGKEIKAGKWRGPLHGLPRHAYWPADRRQARRGTHRSERRTNTSSPRGSA